MNLMPRRGFRIREEDWKKIEGLFPHCKNTEKLSIGKTIFPPGKEIMFSDSDDFLAVTQLMDEMKIPYTFICDTLVTSLPMI